MLRLAVLLACLAATASGGASASGALDNATSHGNSTHDSVSSSGSSSGYDCSASGSGSSSALGDEGENGEVDSGGHGSGGGFTISNATGWCRYHSYAELDAFVRACDPDGSARDTILDACNSICLAPAAPEYLRHCSAHTHHALYADWQHAMTAHPSLQWNIFFIIFSMLVGALIMRFFPPEIPYTVGLLLVFIILGLIAERLVVADDCPHHAWAYAAEHEVRLVDGHKIKVKGVDRQAWNQFIGAGLDPNSFCILGEDGSGEKRRSCGDGSIDPSGCTFKFDKLNFPFKLSDMHVESVADRHSEVLLADELWTFRCNWLKDMLGLSDIDPHQLLVIFLPPLLFESACFGIDMGLFQKQVFQICLLAFPAMIVASGITGALIYTCFPHWSFWVCWLIGIILSATDPVAVVALLKELGASKALGTLIEGESLLNDGSAVVLYTWVRNCIGYSSGIMPPGWMLEDGVIYERFMGNITAELFRIITQMLIFGVAYGVCFGWATMTMCRLMYNKQFIEGPIVLAMSYLCFWIGELVCGTSAVIGVVIMGLYCNYHRSNITAHVFHFLHQLYGMAAHILNTVIFAICGAKLGFFMGDGSLLMLWETYWWQILMIYPFVLLARGAAITLFFPALSRMGTGCTWREAVIMWWGGLRGSVGLALALVMQHLQYDSQMWGTGKTTVATSVGDIVSLDCRDQPAAVVLMTVVVVFLTVVVNGITMAPLMRYLRMTDVTDNRKMMLNGSFSKLRQTTEHCLHELRGEQTFFKDVAWSYVLRSKHGMDLSVFYPDIEDVPKAAWLSVLNLERASYLRQYEHGVLTREAFAHLEAFMASISADANNTAAEGLHALYMRSFHKLVGLLKKDKMSFYDRTLLYHVAKAYITAQIDVKHKMALYKKSEAQAHDVGDALAVDRMQRARQAAIDAMTRVEAEHLEILDTMRDLLAFVEDFGGNAGYARKQKAKFVQFKTRYACKLVLLEQRECVEHLVHEGLLDDLDAAPLIAAIDQKIEAIELAPLTAKINKYVERYLPCLMLKAEPDVGANEAPAEASEPKRVKGIGVAVIAASRASCSPAKSGAALPMAREVAAKTKPPTAAATGGSSGAVSEPTGASRSLAASVESASSV